MCVLVLVGFIIIIIIDAIIIIISFAKFHFYWKVCLMNANDEIHFCAENWFFVHRNWNLKRNFNYDLMQTMSLEFDIASTEAWIRWLITNRVMNKNEK